MKTMMMMMVPSSTTTTTLVLVLLLSVYSSHDNNSFQASSRTAGSPAGFVGRVVNGFSFSSSPSPVLFSRHHRQRQLQLRSTDSIILLRSCSKSSSVSVSIDDDNGVTSESLLTTTSAAPFSSILSTAAAVAACSFCCIFGGYVGVPAAAAANASPLPSYTDVSKILDHNYDDPLHPQCLRRVSVDRSDPSVFHFKGTRVGDGNSNDDEQLLGCSYKEIREFGPLKNGAFDGKIIIEDGGRSNSASATGPIDMMTTTVKLDAGDGVHVGVWEPATSTSSSGQQQNYNDVDGIRWNDGNKWIVQTKPIGKSVGEVIFLAYIGFSTLAGFKGVYDAIQRKRTEASNE